MIVGPDEYKPPGSREELLSRYASGERNFPNTELSDADLSGVTLDGASFDKWSWFFNANFKGASLRGTSFGECNVKCANFGTQTSLGRPFGSRVSSPPTSMELFWTVQASKGQASTVIQFATAMAFRSGAPILSNQPNAPGCMWWGTTQRLLNWCVVRRISDYLPLGAVPLLRRAAEPIAAADRVNRTGLPGR